MDPITCIIQDLAKQGYSIREKVLPDTLCHDLKSHLSQMSEHQFHQAGIGRGIDYQQVGAIRKDVICWITGESKPGQAWLKWVEELKIQLNRQLFMGLFHFESHFAHYRPGDFYRKHVDAFRGEQNRVLTIVVYLNHAWQEHDGGELVLYLNDDESESVRVLPQMGTVALFLSEAFPHEVLPALRDRYSIAGWFRVNSSQSMIV